MKCDWEQHPDSVLFTSKLGTAALIMMEARKYLYFPMASLKIWIQPAILHDQIRFFFDHKGLPVGYLTWAWLTEEVEHRFMHDPSVILHISEWNEGDRLWFLDFAAPTGFALSMMDQIRESMFLDQNSAKSLQRRPDGSVTHVTTWRRHASR